MNTKDTKSQKVLDANRRVAEGVAQFIASMARADAMLGRTDTWLALDMNKARATLGADAQVFIDSLTAGVLETLPADGSWGVTSVFPASCGDRDFVFVKFSAEHLTEDEYPFLAEILSAINGIPMIEGDQLKSLCQRKESIERSIFDAIDPRQAWEALFAHAQYSDRNPPKKH
jgi:hypothetical protein